PSVAVSTATAPPAAGAGAASAGMESVDGVVAAGATGGVAASSTVSGWPPQAARASASEDASRVVDRLRMGATPSLSGGARGRDGDDAAGDACAGGSGGGPEHHQRAAGDVVGRAAAKHGAGHELVDPGHAAFVGDDAVAAAVERAAAAGIEIGTRAGGIDRAAVAAFVHLEHVRAMPAQPPDLARQADAAGF